MSSKDVAVMVRDLSKSYTIAHNKTQHSTMAEALMHKLRNPVQKAGKETFWALKDISFDIQRGDVVGIIGRNGAGKSTLLKILSRITEPAQGKVLLNGRVGSLLEVGTGFHAELTGRENIFLNGAILGMSKREIAQQFDAIVEFSGVEQFLDTPVKRYSSGMYVRLAFAVAAHLNPEILIVDEVLAVGDAEFQKKCLGKMQDVAKSGRTVLFVSHNMNAVVSLCNKGLYLRNGKLVINDDINKVLDEYLITGAPQSVVDLREHANRRGSYLPHFDKLAITNGRGESVSSFAPGDSVRLDLHMHVAKDLHAPKIGIGVTNLRGERVFAIASYLSPSHLPTIRDAEVVRVTFDLPNLMPGTYALDISASDGDHSHLDEIPAAAYFEIEDVNLLECSEPYFSEMGNILVPSRWAVESQKHSYALVG
jgi:lipopolysaccharide transport system ATP-binding protein